MQKNEELPAGILVFTEKFAKIRLGIFISYASLSIDYFKTARLPLNSLVSGKLFA